MVCVCVCYCCCGRVLPAGHVIIPFLVRSTVHSRVPPTGDRIHAASYSQQMLAQRALQHTTMSLVRHLPSTRPAWRTLVGMRCYVDGELLPPKLLLQSSYAAFSRQPSIQHVLPSPPSRRSHSVLRRCVRPGGAPGATIALNEHASRKRLLEGRRLSTQKTGDVNNNSNNNCWKCGVEISWREHFCKCGVIQLLDERLDYFELFQCTPSVFLGLKEVEMRFKNMQRAFHPVSTPAESLLQQRLPQLILLRPQQEVACDVIVL